MIVSVLTMIKNEAKRIPEWLYFHKKVHDIDRFVFYLDSPSDNSRDILDSLKEQYNIEYFDTRMNNPYRRKKNEFAKGRQTDSFTLGSIYLKNISDWIAIFDVDEFVVPNEDKRLKDVLATLDKSRLYIHRWYFKPPFDLSKSMLDQCFYRWGDQERIKTGHRWSGKSIFKTSEYHNTEVNTHYGPYPKNCIEEAESTDFKIHHFQTQMTQANTKFEVFDNSIIKYFGGVHE